MDHKIVVKKKSAWGPILIILLILLIIAAAVVAQHQGHAVGFGGIVASAFAESSGHKRMGKADDLYIWNDICSFHNFMYNLQIIMYCLCTI